MRKITLFLIMLTISVVAFSQNCLQVSAAGTGFTNPSNDGVTWTLTINYTASGNKTLELVVKCGTTVILSDCFQSNGSGTKVYTGLTCAGGINSLSAVFTPRTGACGSAACSAGYILPPGGGPLPVKLSSFFAKRNKNTVALNWHTETEINSKEFVVERKTGNNFVAVATVAASNNPVGNYYSYNDNNLNKGVSLYRLKIVDIDGAISYSDVSAVKGTADTNDFTIFPNPSSGNAKVSISDISAATSVQLVDLSGRVIKNISITNSNTIEFIGLQKGIYMVRILNKTSGESVTQKLTVVN